MEVRFTEIVSRGTFKEINSNVQLSIEKKLNLLILRHSKVLMLINNHSEHGSRIFENYYYQELVKLRKIISRFITYSSIPYSF
jgi:hypothetical protein